MKLKLEQPFKGYRYSIDAFLLADFCKIHRKQKILELGSGCGIISLLLKKLYPDVRIIGIEIQTHLLALAIKNLQKNRMDQNIQFISGDIRKIKELFLNENFDVVITNPPYYQIGTGRLNKITEKASAKHEINACLEDFIKAGFKVLRAKGSFYIIYNAKRTCELIDNFIKNEMQPKILKNIHSRNDSEANLVLIKAIKHGKPGIKILPPLILYGKNKKFSKDMAKIMKKLN